MWPFKKNKYRKGFVDMTLEKESGFKIDIQFEVEIISESETHYKVSPTGGQPYSAQVPSYLKKDQIILFEENKK